MNTTSKAQDSWVQALISIRDIYYRMKSSQSGSMFQRYWMRTGFGGIENGKYIVICDDEEQRDWLADRGKTIAENILVGVLGERVEVEFITKENVK